MEERERGMEEKEREVEEREKRRSITLTAITTVPESGMYVFPHDVSTVDSVYVECNVRFSITTF